jgi:hypothetical protein
MREKPENTSVSEDAWLTFNELADDQGYGDLEDDWMAWFIAFEVGFIAGLED